MIFEYTERNLEFWQRHLEDFVPARLYDMHVHLWTEKGQEHLLPDDNPMRMEVGLDVLRKYSSSYYPGRECHFLLLGTPILKMNAAAHNRWLADEAAKDPASAAGMLVTPETEPEELDAGLSSGRFLAVTPYRLFAPDPARARITEFLPERLIEVIDQHKKAVTLHLSMPDGAASEQNLKNLQYLTLKYPSVKWILAHCARAFNASFLEQSIHVLKGLPNIYCDTAAVNDLYSHFLLLKHEKLDRIMFGADNAAAGGMHGKYITYADAWQFYPGAPHLEHCRAESVPVIYEQLLQQKRAADMLGFSRDEVEKLFWRNACDFLRGLRSHEA